MGPHPALFSHHSVFVFKKSHGGFKDQAVPPAVLEDSTECIVVCTCYLGGRTCRINLANDVDEFEDKCIQIEGLLFLSLICLSHIFCTFCVSLSLFKFVFSSPRPPIFSNAPTSSSSRVLSLADDIELTLQEKKVQVDERFRILRDVIRAARPRLGRAFFEKGNCLHALAICSLLRREAPFAEHVPRIFDEFESKWIPILPSSSGSATVQHDYVEHVPLREFTPAMITSHKPSAFQSTDPRCVCWICAGGARRRKDRYARARLPGDESIAECLLLSKPDEPHQLWAVRNADCLTPTLVGVKGRNVLCFDCRSPNKCSCYRAMHKHLLSCAVLTAQTATKRRRPALQVGGEAATTIYPRPRERALLPQYKWRSVLPRAVQWPDSASKEPMPFFREPEKGALLNAWIDHGCCASEYFTAALGPDAAREHVDGCKCCKDAWWAPYAAPPPLHPGSPPPPPPPCPRCKGEMLSTERPAQFVSSFQSFQVDVAMWECLNEVCDQPVIRPDGRNKGLFFVGLTDSLLVVVPELMIANAIAMGGSLAYENFNAMAMRYRAGAPAEMKDLIDRATVNAVVTAFRDARVSDPIPCCPSCGLQPNGFMGDGVCCGGHAREQAKLRKFRPHVALWPSAEPASVFSRASELSLFSFPHGPLVAAIRELFRPVHGPLNCEGMEEEEYDLYLSVFQNRATSERNPEDAEMRLRHSSFYEVLDMAVERRDGKVYPSVAGVGLWILAFWAKGTSGAIAPQTIEKMRAFRNLFGVLSELKDADEAVLDLAFGGVAHYFDGFHQFIGGLKAKAAVHATPAARGASLRAYYERLCPFIGCLYRMALHATCTLDTYKETFYVHYDPGTVLAELEAIISPEAVTADFKVLEFVRHARETFTQTGISNVDSMDSTRALPLSTVEQSERALNDVLSNGGGPLCPNRPDGTTTADGYAINLHCKHGYLYLTALISGKESATQIFNILRDRVSWPIQWLAWDFVCVLQPHALFRDTLHPIAAAMTSFGNCVDKFHSDGHVGCSPQARTSYFDSDGRFSDVNTSCAEEYNASLQPVKTQMRYMSFPKAGHVHRDHAIGYNGSKLYRAAKAEAAAAKHASRSSAHHSRRGTPALGFTFPGADGILRKQAILLSADEVDEEEVFGWDDGDFDGADDELGYQEEGAEEEEA